MSVIDDTVYRYRSNSSSVSRKRPTADALNDILLATEYKIAALTEHFPAFGNILPNITIKAYMTYSENMARAKGVNTYVEAVKYGRMAANMHSQFIPLNNLDRRRMMWLRRAPVCYFALIRIRTILRYIRNK